MDVNLLLEQYSRYKKIALDESPYKCLLNTEIEINPHQINAFCAAIESLKTGGIVLADEVGLGKTIEAGLVIKYVLDSGARQRRLLGMPRWNNVLAEFNLFEQEKILQESIVLRDWIWLKEL